MASETDLGLGSKMKGKTKFWSMLWLQGDRGLDVVRRDLVGEGVFTMLSSEDEEDICIMGRLEKVIGGVASECRL